ncbi:MAG: gliding-motility protein MglA, partial [Nitrospirota bacterium]
SRKLILKGVDGVVFVADSQMERADANLESMDDLQINLKDHGFELDTLPYAVQYNKRDLPNAIPVDEMESLLNPRAMPSFEAVATTGQGVFETLKDVARQVILELKKQY